MKQPHYNNFFIGIELPEKSLNKYHEFLKETGEVFPFLKLSKSKFPHITISFLGKTPEKNVNIVKTVVKEHVTILKNEKITVTGFSYFSNKDTKVLFLEVSNTEMLDKFHKNISENIQDHFETTWHDFIPHLTMARVQKEDFEKFENVINNIKTHFDSARFEFDVTEVGLFGRDPKINNKMIKIDTISVF